MSLSSVNQYPLIAVVGTTASGKTTLAVDLAADLSGEILSADSRQVFRRMDIGTGKDLRAYTLKDNQKIPYHLIDLVEPGTPYNLHQWLYSYKVASRAIRDRGKIPILCGGSGLYVETALSGRELTPVNKDDRLRKELEALSYQDLLALIKRFRLPLPVDYGSHRRAVRAVEIARYYAVHPEEIPSLVEEKDSSPNREPHIILFIDQPKELRLERIGRRLRQRLDEGMIEEVASLLKEGIPKEVLINYGLEYRFLTLYLCGELNLEEAVSRLEIAIRQFAKRQMTWFRGMERRGFVLHRIDGTQGRENLLKDALGIIEASRRSKAFTASVNTNLGQTKKVQKV